MHGGEKSGSISVRNNRLNELEVLARKWLKWLFMKFKFYREICWTERVWYPERKRKNEGNIVGTLAKINSKSKRLFHSVGTWSLALKGSRICYPKICLFSVDYFELMIKKLQTQEKLRRPTRSCPFLSDIYIYKENHHFQKLFPLCVMGEKDDSKSLDTFTNGDSNEFNLHNSHIDSVLFLMASPNWSSTPASPFVFSWRWYLRWWLGPFQRVISFFWISPIYTRGMHVIKLLFVCYYSVFYSKGSQPRTWKGRGKIILPSA